jgi:nucleoside-diphosphate-sugar epimerase
MKIVITGGAGYIGCRLSESLLKKGHDIVCIDWLKYGIEPILNIIDHPNFELHCIDICDKAIEPIIKNADAVIHLAGIVGFPACNAQPEVAYKVNVEGTKRVIDASIDKKLIYASTGSVYGALNSICSETSPVNPISSYSVYKLMGEDYLKNTSAIIFRPATAFGVSNRLRHDLLVNDFTRKAILEKQIVLFEGHFKRTFISVNDLVKSFVFGIENYNQMNGHVWNIGDKELNYTKLEIAKIIKKYVDYDIVLNENLSHDLDGRNYYVNYDKIESIGFRATEKIDDGIKNLIKIYNSYKV